MNERKLPAGVLALLAQLAHAQVPEPITVQTVERIKNIVAYDLLDPNSAQFRGMFATVDPNERYPTSNLCGEINAKNSMGAYTGFRKFYAIETLAKSTFIFQIDGSPRVFILDGRRTTSTNSRFEGYEVICKDKVADIK